LKTDTSNELVNLYRSPKDRYYRGWQPRLLVLLILIGVIALLLTHTPLLKNLEGAHDKSQQQSHVKAPPVQTTIPTTTTVKPANGATIAPVTSGPTTLTTTISVSCPAAVSLWPTVMP